MSVAFWLGIDPGKNTISQKSSHTLDEFKYLIISREGTKSRVMQLGYNPMRKIRLIW